MPQMLTRVRPNRLSTVSLHHASVAAAYRKGLTDVPAKAGPVETTSRAHKPVTANGTTATPAEAVQRIDVAHHGRDDCQEMQLLTSVQHCLSAIQSAKGSSRTTVNQSVAESATPTAAHQQQPATTKSNTPKAPSLAASQATASKPRHDSARVQIRLSKKLVRILAAFHTAGQKPSNVIECTMWRDARIQDAATILGLTVPVQQTLSKDKR